MNYQDTCAALESLGWREGRDQFKPYARMFYKRYDTPTRCSGNDDKAGMQVCLYVSEWEDTKKVNIEIELHGGLSDGTWVHLKNYCLSADIDKVLILIPRMLTTWEVVANHHVTCC